VRQLVGPIVRISVVLLIPVLPFLLFGARMEAWIESWNANPLARPATALLVVGLLAGDIFLPIPSSVVSTLGGAQLGSVLGTVVSWLGMTLGAVIGFAIARRWGYPIAARLSSPEELEQMGPLSQRYGPSVLALTRAVPVLAEASVLLLGVHRLSWRRFLPPVVLGNLGLAVAYSFFGDYAQTHQWLPLGLAVSVALPVLATAVLRFFWPRDVTASR
jgi:uncharacterized membrane protein YdjX (TVP38/TMEM64 family)